MVRGDGFDPGQIGIRGSERHKIKKNKKKVARGERNDERFITL